MQANENFDIESYYLGNDYYIVDSSIKTSYVRGNLLRSSRYYSLGTATMNVSTTLSAEFSFGFEIGSDELKAKLGYTTSTTFTISDSYSTTVKENQPIAIYCYENLERKDFTVYEDDLWFDDYVGEFYSTKPIGCTFVTYRI